MIKIYSAAKHRELGAYISKRLSQSTEPKYVDFLTKLQAKNDARLQIAERRESKVAVPVKKKSVFLLGNGGNALFEPLCEQVA
ncbi:MAG: hypothetical protein WC506_04420 [Candidatus Micrarchaeia archaeon]